MGGYSIEVCLSGSGHPACGRRRSNGQALSPRWVIQRVELLVGLPPRGRPHCWRSGTHGDKSERLEAPPDSLSSQGKPPGSASGQPLAVCDDFSSHIKQRSSSASEQTLSKLEQRRNTRLIAFKDNSTCGYQLRRFACLPPTPTAGWRCRANPFHLVCNTITLQRQTKK